MLPNAFLAKRMAAERISDLRREREQTRLVQAGRKSEELPERHLVLDVIAKGLLRLAGA